MPYAKFYADPLETVAMGTKKHTHTDTHTLSILYIRYFMQE